MNNSTTTSSEKRTCPCKSLPWSLSSFTAAEFGNVHSLLQQQQQRQTRPATGGGTNVWNRRDDAGYTPLHFAAQHNHVAATSLLLQLGADVNGVVLQLLEKQENCTEIRNNDDSDGTCTKREKNQWATPLHRAAFSGATATMIILLQEKQCNLLVKDTSFGDLKTPLHKAAAGGRYLAVQLLLDELKVRNQLEAGLDAKDSSSLTPLQVAQEIVCQRKEEQERQSVARWDVVAGGVADWTKCLALLRAATLETVAVETNGKGEQRETTTSIMANPPATVLIANSSKGTMHDLPPSPYLSTNDGCLDCELVGGGEDGDATCLSSSWKVAFQAALEKSADLAILRQQSRNASSELSSKLQSFKEHATASPPPELSAENMESASATGIGATPDGGGIACKRCGKQAISLYHTKQYQLVCKSCSRLGANR